MFIFPPFHRRQTALATVSVTLYPLTNSLFLFKELAEQATTAAHFADIHQELHVSLTLSTK
jgi:hypothetical protein